MATSSIRDAPNAAAVVRAVAAQTGMRLRFLSGAVEAVSAYRACRRWFGAAPDRLTLVDIGGGGTLELTAGTGEQPETAHSVALGVRTVRNWCSAENPSPAELPALRSCVRRREAAGGRHAAALRHLCTEMLGQLFHCLQPRQLHDPIKAFGTVPPTAAARPVPPIGG
ncbi:Ppx/GppA phosphatase family protein [Salinifilum ghardaiensis]